MANPVNPQPGRSYRKETRRRFSGASSDPAVEAQLEAILQHMYGFYHTEIELDLGRTYRFLDALGNPHLRLPPVVHVAGTNGKGSTIAALRALFEASGHKVHVYTSPHLVHATERIRLAGELVSSEKLVALLNECIEINQNRPITFFELFTCAALLGFSREPADWLILETGMGGRLDTTNVVTAPALTIITAISYDHMKFLGNSLRAIAREKAGILKKGVPCVVGYQFDEAIAEGVPDVILQASQDLSPVAPLYRYGAEWSTGLESGQMLFRYEDDSILLPKPSLSGNHQLWNAGAALAAFRIISPGHFKPEILSTAMGNIEWPGRLQTLENHVFQSLVPQNWEIVIDGGHNDTAGLVLARQIEEWRENDSRPLHLVVAMVNRKDPTAFLRPLLPYADSLTVTSIDGEATSFRPEEMEAAAMAVGFQKIYKASSAREAIETIVRHENVQAPSRILMAGSLFFIGNILGK
ncbi:MAG TPA: folylpolyglutamate synthase/dihydrofolate synthase family protein [Micavibrio sp.]|nr:folylpolyglutamate synthase/dihydrofolate synthase family protein [Micavibrio sp.]